VASLVRPPAAAALRPFVSSLGLFEGELRPARERILPTGNVDLMVNLHEDELRTYGNRGEVHRTRGAALSGPYARHTVIDTAEQRHILWVGFRYGGAAACFDLPLREARDQLVDLEHLWGRDGAVLRERLLEASTTLERFGVLEEVLVDRLTARDRDPAVVAAARALDGGLPVAELSRRLGLSARQLARRFAAATGLTPKRFGRVRRLQHVLRGVAGNGRVEWAEVAVEHGFCDQSHLVHDFGELAGMTPTAYRPRSPGEWNHVPVV
jgi:AraC-like DNA-binding protein